MSWMLIVYFTLVGGLALYSLYQFEIESWRGSTGGWRKNYETLPVELSENEMSKRKEKRERNKKQKYLARLAKKGKQVEPLPRQPGDPLRVVNGTHFYFEPISDDVLSNNGENINPALPVRTRDGRLARLDSIDTRKAKLPILAWICQPGAFKSTFSLTGGWTEGTRAHPSDLFNITLQEWKNAVGH